jgi:Xaa-Pro dipeptidase
LKKKQFPLEAIQHFLALQNEVAGWLIYDFRGHNSIATEVLAIPEGELLSRRYFYWIPKRGTPLKIVHQIEADLLSHIPGDQITYESWKSLDLALSSSLKGQKKIAMEHSPKGAIPIISKLDSGMYEWLLEKNIAVSCSWPIAQHFVAKWTPMQFKQHVEASKILVGAYKSCWKKVREALQAKTKITEYELQQHILEIFAANNLKAEHPPIVAFSQNAANAHYNPTSKNSAVIQEGAPLLIDLWAKKQVPYAPYADITQVAFVGKDPPKKMVEVYDALYKAQTAAIDFIKESAFAKQEIAGFQVDDVCRVRIQEAGFGAFFTHRTGHNIHTDLHGLGPNIDNYETHDTRILTPNTCYSIEPGIYIQNSFGMRLECNVFLSEDGLVEVTGKSSPQLPCLLT